MKWKNILVLCFILALFTVGTSFFIVTPKEFVIVLKFGYPSKVIKKPGIYMKYPDPVESIYVIDKRVLVSEFSPSEMLTVDKKNLLVNYYVVWRVKDPLRFLTTLKDRRFAEYRINDIIGSSIRENIGRYNFSSVVSMKRGEIGDKVITSTSGQLERYGIEILDVGIKRVNLPQQNLEHVYERMRSERRRIANMYRAEGTAKASKIIADTNLEATKIISNAKKNATLIRGEADSLVAEIYGKTFSEDENFYRFIRTMELYKAMNKNITIYITTDSELFRYLKSK